MACHWHVDKKTGERVHVPECWGTVHSDDGVCHCPDRPLDPDERVTIDERIADLETTVGRLTAAIESLRNQKRNGRRARKED